ncbi:MAG: hypothetical protein ABGW87_07705 [Sphingomonadaceae bacterium]
MIRVVLKRLAAIYEALQGYRAGGGGPLTHYPRRNPGSKGDKKSQDDELIVTSDCIAYRDRQAARKVLSRALVDFEPTLVEMERRYGIRNQ